jgi:hypothetical protein
MRHPINLIFTLVITVLFLAGLYTSREWSIQARLFPWTIGLPALGLCLTQLLMDLWKARKGQPEPTADDQRIMDLAVDRDVPNQIVVRRATTLFAWILGLFTSIWLVGFLISLPLFVLSYLRLQSRETWRMSLAWTCCTVAFTIGLFHYILRAPWPYPVIGWPQELLLQWL